MGGGISQGNRIYRNIQIEIGIGIEIDPMGNDTLHFDFDSDFDPDFDSNAVMGRQSLYP